MDRNISKRLLSQNGISVRPQHILQAMLQGVAATGDEKAPFRGLTACHCSSALF